MQDGLPSSRAYIHVNPRLAARRPLNREILSWSTNQSRQWLLAKIAVALECVAGRRAVGAIDTIKSPKRAFAIFYDRDSLIGQIEIRRRGTESGTQLDADVGS
jgi:hypothetical protein